MKAKFEGAKSATVVPPFYVHPEISHPSVSILLLQDKRHEENARKQRTYRFKATLHEIFNRVINEQIQLFPGKQFVVIDTVFEPGIAKDRHSRVVSGTMANYIVKDFQLSKFLIELLHPLL